MAMRPGQPPYVQQAPNIEVPPGGMPIMPRTLPPPERMAPPPHFAPPPTASANELFNGPLPPPHLLAVQALHALLAERIHQQGLESGAESPVDMLRRWPGVPLTEVRRDLSLFF